MLVGSNGSGKSNFLRALALLGRSKACTVSCSLEPFTSPRAAACQRIR